jgi:hypothetical protein
MATGMLPSSGDGGCVKLSMPDTGERRIVSPFWRMSSTLPHPWPLIRSQHPDNDGATTLDAEDIIDDE